MFSKPLAEFFAIFTDGNLCLRHYHRIVSTFMIGVKRFIEAILAYRDIAEKHLPGRAVTESAVLHSQQYDAGVIASVGRV